MINITYNLRNFISIFGVDINLYGLVYFFSFAILFFILRKYLIEKKMDKDLSYIAIIYLVLGTIIGARIFHIIFYNPDYYISNPLKMIFVWEGGLSYHGGLLGAIISGLLFSRKHKLDFLEAADIIVIPLSFFLFLGRIVNFLDQEILGKASNVLWCTKFPNDVCRHPVQLYEGIKNLFLFFYLFNLKKKSLKKGTIFLLFLFLYSSLRFLIDFTREYNFSYLALGTGQYFDIFIAVISLFFLLRRKGNTIIR